MFSTRHFSPTADRYAGAAVTSWRREQWTAAPPNRNGGRHCCQPPLRRAKDLPPFPNTSRGTRLRTLAHQLRRRFPSTAPSEEEPDLPTSMRRPKPRFPFRASGLTEVKTSRCSAALLGMICLRPLCRPTFRRTPDCRVAQVEDHLFRRLFPAGSGKSPKEPAYCLPAEIGPLVTCRPVLPLPAV